MKFTCHCVCFSSRFQILVLYFVTRECYPKAIDHLQSLQCFASSSPNICVSFRFVFLDRHHTLLIPGLIVTPVTCLHAVANWTCACWSRDIAMGTQSTGSCILNGSPMRKMRYDFLLVFPHFNVLGLFLLSHPPKPGDALGLEIRWKGNN